MNNATHTANPFYASRLKRVAPRNEERDRPVYAKLPLAPKNASPVPHLTSLYHFDQTGDYGDRKWPGNCGGNLIEDLLKFYLPNLVLDPMAGSGTCQDVCDALGIACMSWDIHRGFDACDATDFPTAEAFDFIFCHPPYWRQKLYADTPLDLSRAPTLEEFLRRYGQFFRNCARVLKPGGKLAVLVGDYHDRQAGFIPLIYQTKRLAIAAGLRQSGTDIIRFLHGTTSSRKVYRTSFIPTMHDVCAIFERA